MKMYIFPVENGDIPASYVSLPEGEISNFARHQNLHVKSSCLEGTLSGSQRVNMLALEFRLHSSNSGFNAFPERPIFLGINGIRDQIWKRYNFSSFGYPY